MPSTHPRRSIQGTPEDAVEIPPVGMTALTWGFFMGVSSNLRYNMVVGLERAADMTLERAVPGAGYAVSTGLRFGNNIVGGMNYIDIARWTGI